MVRPRGGGCAACTLAVLVLLLLLLLVAEEARCEEDLYGVLGVARSATAREVRSAHKRLAKEWHPDKNKSPEAQEKIMQINSAYEILSDDEKRQRYDLTGETGESPPARGAAQGHTVFTFHNGRSFHFFTGGGSPHRSDAISAAAFFSDVLPNSHHKPYLLTFHHEFCMQCAQLEQVWRELHNELAQLGVGVASVHSTTQPRIATHCGASRVPAVVGVVSGRVVHYHGRWGGVAVYKAFLESLLPSSIITELSGSADPDGFLSQAVARNRPRVLLFSQRETPSLLFKLTAFAHQSSADFAYVSTDPAHLGTAVSQRFHVLPRERRLMLFKEDCSQPALEVQGSQLSGEKLRSLVAGLSLHLPRLSSPHWLDLLCPPGSTRLCLLLLVEGASAYSDDVTTSFRRLAKESGAGRAGWGYVDTSKQSDFLQSFGPIPTDLKQCPDGSLARPVIAMKRPSPQSVVFDWFVGLCGLEQDVGGLLALLATPTLSHSGPLLHAPVDEEAPGRLGRLSMKVTQFFYDLSDFISAVDSHMVAPLISLSVTALLICLVGALYGTSDDDTKNSHSSKRNGERARHSQRKPSPSKREDVIHKLNQSKYYDFIQHAPKGLVALVVFVDSYKQEESRNLIHSFWMVAQRFLSHRTRMCFVCYRTHGLWLSRVLQESGELTSREIDARLGGCFSGEVVTILAAFGAKKRFCLFPDSLRSRSSSPSVPNGSTKHSQRSPAGHGSVKHSQRSPAGPRGNHHSDVSQPSVEQRSVGQVLGSALGFDDAEANTASAVQSTTQQPAEASSQSDHNSEVSETIASSHDATELLHDHHRVKSRLSAWRLETWLERLVDGTLKRYSVDSWPEWS